MKYTEADLCQLGQGCFGCCGRNYKSKKEIEKALVENISDFHKIVKNGTIEELKRFRDRHDKNDLHACGICYNLIIINGKLGCPLHPKVCGQELREDHCDILHLCRAAKMFSMFDDDKKAEFIEFLLKKKLDWYEFSMGMDNDNLLKEFLRENKNKINNNK